MRFTGGQIDADEEHFTVELLRQRKREGASRGRSSRSSARFSQYRQTRSMRITLRHFASLGSPPRKPSLASPRECARLPKPMLPLSREPYRPRRSPWR